MDKNESRRRAYAMMDSEKKEELRKRQRESYARMDEKKKENLRERRRLRHASQKEMVRPHADAVHSFERGDQSSPSVDPAAKGSTSQRNNISSHPIELDHSDLPNDDCVDVHSYKVVPGIRPSVRHRRQSKRQLRAHIDITLYPSSRVTHTAYIESGSIQSFEVMKEDSDISLTSPFYQLPAVSSCKYCSAKLFYREPPSFCCSGGEIALKSHAMPQALAELYTGNDEESLSFKKFVRSYNNNLSFTTFSARADKELLKNSKGIYVFKVQGKMHHNLPSLTCDTTLPKGIQLYFYDREEELQRRLQLVTHFTPHLMLKLMPILASNPYTIFLKQLKDLPTLEDCTICLTTNPTLDQRVYNLPTSEDVSAIITQEDEKEFNPKCHIQIYNKIEFPYKISHNYACYDPLQYPLIFCRGECGWHYGIEKLPPRKDKKRYSSCITIDTASRRLTSADELIVQEEEAFLTGVRKRNTVSCRQYYSYKLQMRDEDNSMLLHTGRLFQQYIVDMYVKIESSRLDYQKKRQGEIRTEFLQGVIDSISHGHTSGAKVGKKFILPPSFTGGPRDIRKRYLSDT